MTPFSARGRFCAAEATNTSDGRRIAICQRGWLAGCLADCSTAVAAGSRRRLFSTDAERFFMQRAPQARFMIWLRSEILISQKSLHAQHIPIYDRVYLNILL